MAAFFRAILIWFADDLHQCRPVNPHLHAGKKVSCSCILLSRVKELVGEDGWGVLLNHE